MSIKRKEIFFLIVFTFIVKFIFLAIGVLDGRAFDPGVTPDLFAFGELESFRDYGLAYIPTINAFKSGFTPYIDFWYAYPPLFLYTLTAFSYLPLGFWGAALPIVIFDALSVVLVYLICMKFLSEKKSMLISLIFSLVPINLFYNDYLWLNPPLVTFFSLLSTYFFLDGKYGLSAVALGTSFGFKQTSLVLFPVLLILVLKKCGLKKMLKFVVVFVGIVLLVSTPYIFTIPQYYLGCLTSFNLPFMPRPELGDEYYQRIYPSGVPHATDIDQTYPVWGNSPLNPSFIIFMLTSQSLGKEALFSYYNSFNGLANNILNLMLLLSLVILCYRMIRLKEISGYNSLKYILLSLILFHFFYGRGIYKYYLAMITPYLAPFMSNQVRIGLFIVFNVSTLLAPRFLSPWILLPPLLFIVLRPFLTKYYKQVNSPI